MSKRLRRDNGGIQHEEKPHRDIPHWDMPHGDKPCGDMPCGDIAYVDMPHRNTAHRNIMHRRREKFSLNHSLIFNKKITLVIKSINKSH